MKVKVIYCSDYNDCCIYEDDADDPVENKCVEEILDRLARPDIRSVILEAVKNHYGQANLEIEIESA